MADVEFFKYERRVGRLLRKDRFYADLRAADGEEFSAMARDLQDVSIDDVCDYLINSVDW
jgi:hypothetical protein